MNDVVAFLAACFSTPALLTSACALAIVPPLAWLVVRALAPTLRAMDGDPGWQAPLAAAAAALPAFLFIVIGVVTLRDTWGSVCLQFVTGRVLYTAIAVVTVFGFVRAVTLLRRRTAEIDRLIASSTPASPALAAATAAQGLDAREVPSNEAFILLAGIARPVVLVSTEALRRLDPSQLDAAIRHEAAHSDRGDQVISAVVTFVSDIIPLPVGDLVALYRQAREFAADAHAASRIDPCDLAGALLALARGGSVPAGAAALAEAGTVRARLAVLLTDTPPPPSRVRRLLVASSLVTTFALGASPAIAALVYGIQCTIPTMRMT